MSYPDDDNGDVLRRIEAGGNDLNLSRAVDFTVVFPNENSAEQFATHFRGLGYTVSVEFSETAEGFPWDVVVVKHMALSHKAIGDFEDLLQSVADANGGQNDGWGCVSGSPFEASSEAQ